MRYLIDFANNGETQGFVRTILSEARSELFQGVFVSYHPFWRLFADKATEPEDVYRWLHHYRRILIESPLPEIDDLYQGLTLSNPFASDWWRTISNELFDEYRDPFVITFRLRPVGIEQVEEYRKIARTIGKMGRTYFTRIEQRPRAKLYAGAPANPLEGGLKIRTSAGASGTLGGFVQDASSGTHFGVTCAHVAAIGDKIEYFDDAASNWKALGQCVESSPLPGSPDCNVNCYLNAGAVDVDAALIELPNPNASANIKGLFGKVDAHIAPTAIPRSIELVGAECGHLNLNADKFGMWQEFQLPSGECACFKDIFEVNSRSISNLSAKLSLLFSKAVKNGDSGASVVAANANGGFSYCGNIIAGDTISGFATFSKNLIDWAGDPSRVKTPRALTPI